MRWRAIPRHQRYRRHRVQILRLRVKHGHLPDKQHNINQHDAHCHESERARALAARHKSISPQQHDCNTQNHKQHRRGKIQSHGGFPVNRRKQKRLDIGFDVSQIIARLQKRAVLQFGKTV